MLKKVQRPGTHHKLRIRKVGWSTFMIPMDMAQDNIVDILRRIQATFLKAISTIRSQNGGLSILYMNLLRFGVALEVSFDTKIEYKSRLLASC